MYIPDVFEQFLHICVVTGLSVLKSLVNIACRVAVVKRWTKFKQKAPSRRTTIMPVVVSITSRQIRRTDLTANHASVSQLNSAVWMLLSPRVHSLVIKKGWQNPVRESRDAFTPKRKAPRLQICEQANMRSLSHLL